MNIILLSGGSGKRLWPLSNDVRSKAILDEICENTNMLLTGSRVSKCSF